MERAVVRFAWARFAWARFAWARFAWVRSALRRFAPAVLMALGSTLASCRSLGLGPGAERRHADERLEVTWTSPETLADGWTVIRRVRVEPVLPGTIEEVELQGFVDLDGDGAADPGRALTTNVMRPFTRGYVEFGHIRVAASEGVRFFVLVHLLRGHEARIELR